MKAEINKFGALMLLPENRVEGMGIEKWFDEHVRTNQGDIIFCVQPLDENREINPSHMRFGICKCK